MLLIGFLKGYIIFVYIIKFKYVLMMRRAKWSCPF